MRKKNIASTILTCLALTCLTVGSAKANFVNGNFATGDLTGWTVFTTPGGTNGAGLPTVVSFNTTGSGATNSAEFNVGAGGGGIEQTLSLGVGMHTITGAIAAMDDAGGLVNTSAGDFQVLVNGTEVEDNNLGGFGSSFQILRGTLSVDINIPTSGSYTIAFQITRPFLSEGDQTPTQYLTDLSITGASAVPEPATMMPLAGLFGALVFVRFRRVRSRV
jgi:hypothetical protein